jgi:hyperosmotically inducible periplasmic protein
MRLVRTVLLLVLLVIVGVVAYNYLAREGSTLRPSAATDSIDVEKARERGAELARDAAETARDTATKLDAAATEGAITAKIKSKMALDDHVKARSIDVDTSGSVVTLIGVVGSTEERDRAVRLAKETEGVTSVVDKLQIRK